MSEQTEKTGQPEQHPLIKIIANKCKELGVKVEQVQKVVIGAGEGEPDQGLSYYWTVAVPNISSLFVFTSPGDIANALSLVSAVKNISMLEDIVDPETKQVKTKEPVVVIEERPASGKLETLDEVLAEDEEEPAFVEEAISVPSTPVPGPTGATTNGMSFAERQKARQQAAGRPTLKSASTSSTSKSPVVAAGGTLV